MYKNAAQKPPKTEHPGMACMAYCPVKCNHGAKAGSSQQGAPQPTAVTAAGRQLTLLEKSKPIKRILFPGLLWAKNGSFECGVEH